MSRNNSTTNQSFIIEGASCASCVNKIEKALNNVSGVEQVEMNFAQRIVSVDGNVDSSTLIKAVGSRRAAYAIWPVYRRYEC